VTIVREEIRVQSVRAKMIEPGLRLGPHHAVPGPHGRRLRRRRWKSSTSRTRTSRASCSTCATDPGGLLDGAVAVSAAFLPADAVVVSTNGQIAESRASFKASPSSTPRRGGGDPLRRLPAR
jgi:carboxyl-terminal processing protease